ncbi:DUF418 domain-containing protein [Salmonirosea aquatica]|uniref:DUF418 domain-containing protein n=1 Tax=Salmonirosea aquatica TaxID=2654236 RepID=A0A7C9BJT0_9BACT|nr:DUF418 domain-containing protein [Cytophagaceae bacterium SJW1-29]
MNTLTPNTSQRYQSIDLLRGVAVLGILVMNIPSFAYPETFIMHVTDFTGINYWSWAAAMVWFEGTMRGLFSMLFGASCLLILSKSDDLRSADVYFRRLLWLFLFGLFDAYILLWDGDILYGYAIAGFFLVPFRALKPAHLIAMGLALSLGIMWMIAYPSITEKRPAYNEYKAAMADSTQKHKKLTVKQREAITKYEESLSWMKKDTAVINSQIKPMLGSYKEVFKVKWKAGETFQSWKLYDPVFWDEILMMFLGMALFKLGIFTNDRPTNTYLWMTVLGYAIGVVGKLWWVSTFAFTAAEVAHNYETYPVPAYTLHEWLRIAETVGHIGLLLMYRSGWFNWLVGLLAKTGRMALSNYLLQSILCGLFFYGFGFGMFARLQIYETYLFVGAVWAVCILFSVIWLRFFRFGPFEWLWRSLTYWQRQPMRK